MAGRNAWDDPERPRPRICLVFKKNARAGVPKARANAGLIRDRLDQMPSLTSRCSRFRLRAAGYLCARICSSARGTGETRLDHVIHVQNMASGVLIAEHHDDVTQVLSADYVKSTTLHLDITALSTRSLRLNPSEHAVLVDECLDRGRIRSDRMLHERTRFQHL